MYRERMVFHAKPGQVRPLVQIFKEAAELMKLPDSYRMLTDVTGRNWTLVLERDSETLDGLMADPTPEANQERLMQLFASYHQYVDSAYREIFKYE